eukprot:Skav224418  [mRNA]  locus=scaffold657:296368:297105:+ [translate_table: standard]
MPRQFLFKRLCVAVLLVVPAVSEDCQSLLSIQSASNLTTKHIQYFRNGLCNPVGEQGSTKVRDNFLDFSGWQGATLDEVKFEPIWYSITPGQPIPKRCFIDDEVDKPNRIKFLCGRYGSEEVAQDFLSHSKHGTFLVASHCDPAYPEYCAKKYNFAIEGIMTFKFKHLQGFIERNVRMRLAQWHWSDMWYKRNIWTMLVMDKCERIIYNHHAINEWAELRCEKSKLSIATFLDKNHEFRVSPWPY